MDDDRCTHNLTHLKMAKRSFDTKKDALTWVRENKLMKFVKVYHCRFRNCGKYHLTTIKRPTNSVDIRAERLKTPLQQILITEEQAELLKKNLIKK